MIKAVLFDLDGTLLPLDNAEFAKAYFGSLSESMFKYGYEPKKFIETIRLGLKAMVENDGNYSNEKVFWKKFCSIYGEKSLCDATYFEEYYRTDFQGIKSICKPEKRVNEMLELLNRKGIKVVIATNPVFPRIATESRIAWAGIDTDKIELFTTYENSSFCKPNVSYYKEILGKLDLEPQNCLMVGNDVEEDMVAKELGMNVFLLTDCLINRNNTDISSYNNGNFDELQKFIEKL